MRAEWLQNVSRIVVKLGTGVLTDATKHPDANQMQQLVAQMAAQVRASSYGLTVLSSVSPPNRLSALSFKGNTATVILPRFASGGIIVAGRKHSSKIIILVAISGKEIR